MLTLLGLADDETNDPSVQGNNVSGLLGGKNSSSGDSGTVPLVMGLTISPPAPRLSDDKIVKFNLVRDTKETVKEVTFLPSQTTHEAWGPRKEETKSPHSVNLGSGKPKNEDEEEKKRQMERWEKVKKAWKNEKNNPVEVVNRWAERLAFEDADLSGKRPEKLLDRFEQMVPALPMVAVGFAV